MTAVAAPFDLTGPLPRGTVVLEASAGTGKTFTIAGLVVRWVAETGLPLTSVLVVTFTRAATAELRDRVRDLLRDAHDHLALLAVAPGTTTDHPVLRRVAAAPPAERERRRARLARALADIDAATIATIHGFCQHVLDGLGLATQLDRDATLVEDHAELVDEAVEDVLVAARHAGDPLPVDRATLRELCLQALTDRTAPLEPAATGDTTAARRVAAVAEVRALVAARARRRGLLSYDDLLADLDAVLADPHTGRSARAAVRDRYRVVLVDEFQDTDPVQWRIFRTCFVDEADGDDEGGGDDPAATGSRPPRATVLIGDPKQAIYAFRGADVHAYLEAVGDAADRRTLGTSWRSDARLLHGLRVLLEGATFGDDDIAFLPVEHAPGREADGVTGPDGATTSAPVRLRRVREAIDLPRNRQDRLDTTAVRELLAEDAAAEVVRQLMAGDHTADPASPEGWRRVAPRDVAVLVRSNDEARMVMEALRSRGVPSVVGTGASVFTSDATVDWQRLLDALERPSDTLRVRALAVSRWVGWSGQRLDSATEADLDALHDDVHRWGRLLASSGVAALQRALLDERDVRARLLASADGERSLTDLAHVGEVLHVLAGREHLAAAGLAARLRELVAESASAVDEHRMRRLETDDEAVQVLTVHRAKGLEFGVVLLPFLWSGYVEADEVAVFHDDERRRRIDVGGPGHEQWGEHERRALDEQQGEHLRLLYVALTRARHRLVAWYAPSGAFEWSPMGRLLLNRDEALRPVLDQPCPELDDDATDERVARLVAASGGTIRDEVVAREVAHDRWSADGAPPPALRRARFDRHVDLTWRRTSYSALARTDGPDTEQGDRAATALGVTGPATAVDVEEPTTLDEPDVAPVEPVAAGAVEDEDRVERQRSQLGAAADDVVPLDGLARGAAVGTLVHAVLETTDVAAPDLRAGLREAAEREQRRHGLDVGTQLLVDGLEAVVHTPLGAAFGGLRLRDVTTADRLDEVAFELPLTAGPDGRPAVVAGLLDLVGVHVGDDHPAGRWAAQVPDQVARRSLHGFLSGSIDLLLRRTGRDGEPVFHVVDHKTNWLAGPDAEALTVGDHVPAALERAMGHGHYWLQALLYAVAAHRLLRWRVPGYRPAAHLGAVGYLFVRGMVGADTPRLDGDVCGVLAWELPPQLVVAASDLLAGDPGAGDTGAVT